MFYKDDQNGIRGVHSYLCGELGFSNDTFKTLVVKNPSIISKEKESLKAYFDLLSGYSVDKNQAMECLLECPKLLSVNLET